MDVVVSSRHCEVSDRFREHVEEKLARLEKHNHRIIRVEVLLEKETRPREPDRAVRVELTAKSRGPVVRAEALPRTRWLRSTWPWTRWRPRCVAPRTAARCTAASTSRSPSARRWPAARRRRPTTGPTDHVAEHKVGPVTVTGDGPLVVREKAHAAAPMTLEQALYEMELVGHDFYLFVDKESQKPSVVYRRRGYDYGVISLEMD